MTILTDIIKGKIGQDGPMSVANFMALALGHQEHGYYMTRDPLGKAGDFTTAPEISQMFGELIGAWLADCWLKMDSPSSFVLLECGPGRGTLMSDALRATKNVSGFHEAMQLYLMEISPVLKERQKQALGAYNPIWCEDLDDLPTDVPLLITANEFLDALPIEQAVYTQSQWHSRVVTLKDDALFFDVGAPLDLSVDLKPEEGEIYEFSPAIEHFVGDVSARIKAQGGTALFIDYGYKRNSLGETLQAVKGHEYAPVLEDVGEADITAHVNFQVVAAKAKGVDVHGPLGQGLFLKALGLNERATSLAEKATQEQKEALFAALTRLSSSETMGELFKVIVLSNIPEGTPAGFS